MEKSDTFKFIKCPWCANGKFITDCPHNPHKLMQEIKRLNYELNMEQSLGLKVHQFVDAFKELMKDE